MSVGARPERRPRVRCWQKLLRQQRLALLLLEFQQTLATLRCFALESFAHTGGSTACTCSSAAGSSRSCAASCLRCTRPPSADRAPPRFAALARQREVLTCSHGLGSHMVIPCSVTAFAPSSFASMFCSAADFQPLCIAATLQRVPLTAIHSGTRRSGVLLHHGRRQLCFRRV